jgi:hypothetical protein
VTNRFKVITESSVGIGYLEAARKARQFREDLNSTGENVGIKHFIKRNNSVHRDQVLFTIKGGGLQIKSLIEIYWWLGNETAV